MQGKLFSLGKENRTDVDGFGGTGMARLSEKGNDINLLEPQK